jgi:CRISPR/Cas system-associated exonuclease Cas4 (RecB family)
MSPIEPRPYVSASQLVAYAMCPRKYAFRYVYGLEPEFRSTALLLGSAVHGAIGWFFEAKLAGTKPTVEEAQQLLLADLLALSSGTPVRWKTSTPESLEEEGKRLVALYLSSFGDLPVAAVESPFDVDLMDDETGEVLGRPLRGFFDLVLEDHRVIELKTSAKGWPENDLVRHLQVGAYAFAWNTLHGGPSNVEVHVLVKLKREPRIETYHIERGEPANRWWLRAASEIESAILAGNFPPSPSPLCNECEYAHACTRFTMLPGQRSDADRPQHRLPVVEAPALHLGL